VIFEKEYEMKLRSPSFRNNDFIPRKYTCDDADINPELLISDIPPETKSLVLIVDDPDAPKGNWLHWLVYDIPVTEIIKENSIPGSEGINDYNQRGYGGPCPPKGTHHYHFRLFALDTMLNLGSNRTRDEVENAMSGHILDKAEITGLYSRDA